MARRPWPCRSYACGDHWHLQSVRWPFLENAWVREYLIPDIELGTRVANLLYQENHEPQARFEQLARTLARKARQRTTSMDSRGGQV